MNFPQFAVAVCLVGVVSSATAEPLITMDEAQRPTAVTQGDVPTRGIARGPSVNWVSPDPGISVESPFELKVNFDARQDAKIDPDSIKLIYLKSPNVDLTSRLGNAVSAKGIYSKGVEVPPGEHVLKISVRDQEGRETNKQVTITVKK